MYRRTSIQLCSVSNIRQSTRIVLACVLASLCVGVGLKYSEADEQYILQPALKRKLAQTPPAPALPSEELSSDRVSSPKNSTSESPQPVRTSPAADSPITQNTELHDQVDTSHDQVDTSRVPTQLASLSKRPIERPSQQPSRRVVPLEPAPGWQAVGQRLRDHLKESETLLKRRAFLSARAELEHGMLYLLHVMDGMQNRHHAVPAWAAAQQALKEAEDFGVERQQSVSGQVLKRIIQTHETPVLKAADTDQLAPMTAAQHYRVYAQSCLLEAAQGHPWASELLQALGKTYQAQADSSEQAVSSLRLRATVFYRTATLIDPSNALAANQLGFVLLQLDRPRDAQACLISSVHVQASQAALRNLIEASYRIGDSATQRWAEATLSALPPMQAVPQEGAVQLTEVDPQTFVNLSPYQAGPKPQRATAQQSRMPQAPR